MVVPSIDCSPLNVMFAVVANLHGFFILFIEVPPPVSRTHFLFSSGSGFEVVGVTLIVADT